MFITVLLFVILQNNVGISLKSAAALESIRKGR